MYKYPIIGIPTDYSEKDNWHRCPNADERTKKVDVIYFVGTSAANPEGGDISAIDEPTLRMPMLGDFELSIFEPFCNVFFPWWRQVDSTALYRLSPEAVDQLQYAEPRTDVYAVMDYYFEHLNDGRPYILVGHSQGARMISILLEDYMVVHQERYEKMIAAYRIGDGLTKEYLEKNPHVKAAQSAEDTGVCISWNTEGPANASHYGLIVRPGCVCINPINWKTDETYASAKENLGSVILNMMDGTTTTVKNLADARVDRKRGTVVVDSGECRKYADALAWGEEAKALFGPESYHGCDFSFFYYNIRENAKLRIKKWFEKNG